jgi:hypothetical protein
MRLGGRAIKAKRIVTRVTSPTSNEGVQYSLVLFGTLWYSLVLFGTLWTCSSRSATT